VSLSLIVTVLPEMAMAGATVGMVVLTLTTVFGLDTRPALAGDAWSSYVNALLRFVALPAQTSLPEK
jgi:hypothetical protein